MDGGFVDCHCHISAQEFDEDLEDVIQRAKEAGVRTLVSVTEKASEFERVIQLSKIYPGLVAPCLGIHPVQGFGSQDLHSVTEQDLDPALPLFQKYREDIVAIGEIGLDFTPWYTPNTQQREEQQSVFRKQLQISKELDLPVNVHSRSAAKVTIGILKEQGISHALLHNFAGRLSVAMEGVQMGYYFSFPPAVCRNEQVIQCAVMIADMLFRNGKQVGHSHPPKCLRLALSRRVRLIKQIPLEHICLETDSPALGPDKHVRNEPKNIVLSSEYIAQMKGIPPETVVEATTHNALKLFPGIKKIMSAPK